MHDPAERIFSLDEALALAKSLAQRSVRNTTGLFWIEGPRAFLQAHDAGYRFRGLFCSPILLRNVVSQMLVRRHAALGVARYTISPEQFRDVSGAGRASGLGAIVHQRWIPLEQLRADDSLCTLVIEQVRSPGNLGTILRTAEACGVRNVVFVGPHCDPYDPNVVAASMGGVFHLRLARATAPRLTKWLEARGVTLLGLSPEADGLWTDAAIDAPVALAIGEERSGLSNSLRSISSTLVRLPMTGRADSLNVSIATGVMLYEIVRRRQTGGDKTDAHRRSP